MTPASERRIVALIGAVQFVNILDFMMVMPLGPDFARELGIPESDLGWIGGSYLGAAAITGVAGMPLLDRFDRRTALMLALAGLFVGTLLGAFAVDLPTLLASRVVAGAFGGPATAVALAVVTDLVPAERRGRALGAVMGAFSVASVAGVPLGLEAASAWGWRAPFVAVAALGAAVAAMAWPLLPPMRGHLDGGAPAARTRDVLALPGVGLAAAACAAIYLQSFSIIPSIAPFYLGNLAYPREAFEWLYFAGGIASFVTLRVAGRLVDRFGAAPVATLSTAALAVVLVGAFALESTAVPALVWFVGFMVTQSARNVSWGTLSSRIPTPLTRAGFQSLHSTLQHGFAALGTFAGPLLLLPRPGGGLDGMPRLVAVAVVLAGIGLLPIWALERRLRGATG